MTRQRDKPLFLVYAEPRPGWCSTATKESVLRLASSNVFFHRQIFRQQCDAKSKSTFKKGSAACMGMACQRHGRLAINLVPGRRDLELMKSNSSRDQPCCAANLRHRPRRTRSARLPQEAEGASSSLSYSDKATADPETNMSIGLLKYDPHQFTISHFVELLVANIVACAGIGGKTARFKVATDGFTQHGHLIFANVTLVSQTGPGARSEHAAAVRRLPLGTVSWNVSSNFPARPQLI